MPGYFMRTFIFFGPSRSRSRSGVHQPEKNTCHPLVILAIRARNGFNILSLHSAGR